MLVLLAEYYYVAVLFISLLLAGLLLRKSRISVAEWEDLMAMIAEKLDRVNAYSPIDYFGFLRVGNGEINGQYGSRDVICWMSLYANYGPNITFKMKFNQKNKEPKFLFDYPRPTKHTYAKNGYVIYWIGKSKIRKLRENVSLILEELCEGCNKMEAVGKNV